jgi:hypothetical protein
VNRPRDPRERPAVHDPDELGAHALGLLDPAQSRAVEEHLAGCAACRREWEELRGMVDLLDDELLLQRTVRRVRGEARAQRRRRRAVLVAAAAVALGAVLGGGVLIGRTTAPPAVTAAPAPDAVVLSGGGAPGVSMTTTLTPAAGWVRLTTTVEGIPAGERCRIVVEARDGSRHVAGGWLVPPGGWGDDGVTLDGSAIVPLDEVAAVVVESETGRRFATARA